MPNPSGIEIPSMEAPVPDAKAAPVQDAPAKRQSKGKAKTPTGGGLPRSVEAADKLIAEYSAEAAELEAKYFREGNSYSSTARLLEQAARDGRRAQHLESATEACYRLGHLSGVVSILRATRRLREADALLKEAAEVAQARGRVDAAAAALGLGEALTAEAARALKGFVQGKVDGLKKQAEHARAGVRYRLDGVDLEDEASWPPRIRRDAADRRRAKLAAIEKAKAQA